MTAKSKFGTKRRTKPCSICDKPIDVQPGGWDGGHNAEPVNDGRCCTACNNSVVLPFRLAAVLKAGLRNVRKH